MMISILALHMNRNTGFLRRMVIQFMLLKKMPGMHWSFLKTRPKDKPFSLSVSFFATHAQDNHPDQYRYQPESEKYYQDDVIPVPETAADTFFKSLPYFLATDANEGRIRWHWRFDTPEKYQKYMKAYYRMLTELDLAVGRIVEELEESGCL